MFVTTRALATRGELPDAFAGDYLPISTSGTHRDSVFAFARRHGDRSVVTCVPRLIASVIPDAGSPPLGHTVWADTRVEVPRGRYRNVFTGVVIETEDGIRAATLFERFPVALLTST
jgi:(1->4)-alpha-D-glucan 1-alpha-D-glucosylmutase